MRRRIPALLPSLRGRLAPWAIAALGVACASPAPAAASNSTIASSPFGTSPPSPPQASTANTVPLDLELRGVSRVGGLYTFSLYDVRTRTSYWVSPNDTTHPDIQVLSYNPAGTSLVVNARGREMQLSLKAPSSQTMVSAAASPPTVVYSAFGADQRADKIFGYPVPKAPPASAPAAPVSRSPFVPVAVPNTVAAAPVGNPNVPAGNAGNNPPAANGPVGNPAGLPGGYRGGDTITSNISYTLNGVFIGRPILQP
jgi:hypothetical protein